MREAKTVGGERLVLFALGLTNNLLGTALPKEVISKLRFDASIHKLVEHASARVLQAADYTAHDYLTSQRFNWLVRERLRDKLYPYYLHYVTDVILPSDLERRLVPLPRALLFVYYFIRPIRLVGKYGRLLLTRTIQLSARNDCGQQNQGAA